MPVFDSPEPISIVIELSVGDVRLTASKRTDTTVEVRPSDPSHEADVQAAERTRVEFAAGQLLVKGPKPRNLSLFGKPGSIDVTIELPEGSRLRGDASVAAFHGAGRFGACHVKTATGDIQLDHAAAVDLHSGAGAIVVERVAGNAEVSTGSGRVRLRDVGGTAVIKSGNGASWVGTVTGDLRASAANGDIAVDHAGAGVVANTANGDVRIGALVRGSAQLKTAYGAIEVGIYAGTAARLDVSTQFGSVRNELDPADRPESTDETVEVRARSGFGDIVIRRS